MDAVTNASDRPVDERLADLEAVLQGAIHLSSYVLRTAESEEKTSVQSADALCRILEIAHRDLVAVLDTL